MRKWSWIAALVFAISLQAAPLYRVSGTIVDVQSGSPLLNTHVFVLSTGSVRVLNSMMTGSDGKFSFDLPEGKYSLRAGGRDHTQIYGLSAPDALAGVSVFVGPDQHTENLLFRWFPSAAISGKVIDSSGEPIEGALVQLLSSRIIGGRRSITTRGWQRSNDQGEYRFGPFPLEPITCVSRPSRGM